jgi:hypothetical protein
MNELANILPVQTITEKGTYTKGKTALNTIHFLAIVFMFCDHIGKHFFPYDPIWQIIGRFGMVMWPSFIVMGYQHTTDIRQYINRLAMIAVISQAPYVWINGNHLNPVFSLLLGLMIISIQGLPQKIALYLFAWFCWLSFGMECFFFNSIIVYHYLKKPYSTIAIVTFTLVLCFTDHPFQIFILLGIPMMEIRKEFLPRLNRFVKYSIYPGHYTIIGVIKWLFV